MGAYSPTPFLPEATEKRVLEEIVHPTIRGLAREDHPFVGVLYVGLMVDPAGVARVVEFNVRFGDPETQALVVRMTSDLVPLLDGAARGSLQVQLAPSFDDAAVCVVLASGGYPREHATGAPITGYKVYRWSTGSPVTVITLNNVTSYKSTGLTKGVTYSFQVSAVNGGGEGAKSSTVTAKPS